MRIKFIILPAFLFTVIAAAGQKMPPGSFQNKSADTTRVLSFFNTNMAEYYITSLNKKGIAARATYSINGNRLILIFEDTASLPNREKLSIQKKEGNWNTTSLQFHFFDKNNYPVPGVAVTARGDKSGKIYGLASDQAGSLNIVIANIDIPLKLRVNSIGYFERDILIDSPGNYFISCPLISAFDSPFSINEKMEYQIKKRNRKKIVLKEASENISRTYRLIKKPAHAVHAVAVPD